MKNSLGKRGIVEYLEMLKPEIDRIIKKYLPKKANQKWLKSTFGKPHYTYNIKAAQKAILEPTWEFLDRGGKRWRPVLFLLVIEALGGDIRKLKDFAIIPELAHEGSLCLDDVEDDSELRRGSPCLHKIFGVDVALNVGNFLYFLPIFVFEKNKTKVKKEIYLKALQTYLEEMAKLHLGQGTDIYWHKGKTKKINEKEYLQMCAFKTGCMARMAAKLAVILSGESDGLAEKIGNFAESIGVAFQIQDDILDLTLTSKEREKFGKAFGNDIKEGKRTLMVIHTLKKATEKDKRRLLEILNKHTDDLKEKKEAIEIIQKYGGIEYAKKLAEKIIKESWPETEKLLPSSKAKIRLKEFVNYLIERKI